VGVDHDYGRASPVTVGVMGMMVAEIVDRKGVRRRGGYPLMWAAE